MRPLSLFLAAVLAGCGDKEDTGSTGVVDADGDGYAADTDCDDADAAVSPGAEELCDGVDNDCDEQIDEDLATATYYADTDGDGFGDPDKATDACAPLSGYVDNDADCDDADAAVSPGAEELCDGADNDCDALVDDEDDSLDGTTASIWYADDDGDGFGDTGRIVEACTPPSGYTGADGDCDDTDAGAYPGAEEVCDDTDNDCDDVVDEEAVDAPTWYADHDADGYGDPSDVVVGCAQPGGYLENDLDCDDAEPTVYSGAEELCDGVYNDCDDPGYDAASAPGEELDDDGDGYVECEYIGALWVGDATVSDGDDCDDANDVVYPSAEEVCDGQYNDCDDAGYSATSAPSEESDDDGDGYVECEHDSSVWVGDSSVSAGEDCDDTDSEVYPGADEVCDGQYNDCDDSGYSASGMPDDEDDTDADGYAECEGDCDDSDDSVYPGAAELCDGQYNDCDDSGYSARGAPGDESDGDSDGYVECEYISQLWRGSSSVVGGEDCDDADGAISPGADEVCDSTDNDCDGSTDEDPTDAGTWYTDGDGDGYGDPDSAAEGCTQPSGTTSDGSDCDDDDSFVYPGADEVCDGQYNDCDASGYAASGAPDDEADSDGDGYVECGYDSSSWIGSSSVVGGDDCDDDDVSAYPGAQEVCDEADNDCDGDTDEAFVDEDFDSSFSGLATNGSAGQLYFGSDGYIELTDTTGYQAGSLMISDDIPGDVWYAAFDIYIGDGTSSTGGADGMAFVFYDADSVADTYVGSSGSYLGAYNASADGFGVEFDVYDSGSSNNDADGNHIAVIDTSAYPFVDYDYESSIPTLETAATTYSVEIYFLEGDIDVYIDGTLYLSTTITGYSLDTLRMGWTASTGGLSNYHTVDDIYVGCY